MTASVRGTTSLSRSVARSRYSNCPDQETAYPGGSLTGAAHRRLHVVDDRAEVPAAHVDVDPARKARVLAAQHRRTLVDRDSGDVLQQQLGALVGHERQLAQTLQGIADLARVADIDRIALAALDHLADVVAADGGRDDGLNVGDRETEASRSGAIDLDVDVAAAGQSLGQRRRDAGNALDRRFDLRRQLVDRRQVGAGHLDPHGALDACREHVDAIADRRHPDVAEPRHLDGRIELLDQLVGRHAQRATRSAA